MSNANNADNADNAENPNDNDDGDADEAFEGTLGDHLFATRPKIVTLPRMPILRSQALSLLPHKKTHRLLQPRFTR